MAPPVEALQIFYAQFLPRGLEAPLLILILYGAYLFISAGILLVALKTVGAKVSLVIDLPRGVLTILIRDLIAIPLIAIILVTPIIGIIIAFAAWFGILKYFYDITWYQAVLTWIVGSIVQLVLIILIIIPLFLLL
ncbi:TPA: hypothetical protein H1005_03400 [archaeon]|uniref:Yip1 domain-containing protein n=1 Tax=Candidatus Naiadarchaeum limnaeum TaxID=2756139 RepID=A0A832XLU6_9ARCH|nr:hypothetical protein [Candidatus Naiadarchaeales archaeon SRR2090153.bin1042]HIK00353.1 hypothetical protein [Candidatus Naiadarchaeum limnaeum]